MKIDKITILKRECVWKKYFERLFFSISLFRWSSGNLLETACKCKIGKQKLNEYVPLDMKQNGISLLKTMLSRFLDF